MPEIDDRLNLVNQACALIAAKPLQSLETETPLGQSVGLMFDVTYEACLAFYPWTFNTRTIRLQRQNITPENGWTYAYDLVPNVLGNPHALLTDPRQPDNPLLEWAIEADGIFTDVEPVWGIFSLAVEPPMLSASFRMAFVHALAAALVVPTSGNAESQREIMQRAAFGTAAENMRGGWMGAAIQENSRNQPSRRLAFGASPLVNARMYDQGLR